MPHCLIDFCNSECRVISPGHLGREWKNGKQAIFLTSLCSFACDYVLHFTLASWRKQLASPHSSLRGWGVHLVSVSWAVKGGQHVERTSFSHQRMKIIEIIQQICVCLSYDSLWVCFGFFFSSWWMTTVVTDKSDFQKIISSPKMPLT